MGLFRDNPVLQRELVTTLRMKRAFLLQALFLGLLGLLIWAAWPRTELLSLQVAHSSEISQRLFRLFVLGQLFLVGTLAPSFAAGALTSEKEKRCYEMLLASPLTPAAIVWGKFASSLTYLSLLIFSSLPLVSMCFLLGGLAINDIVGAYVLLMCGAVLFGMISLTCSAVFYRTSSALIVSYLAILPIAGLVILIAAVAPQELQTASALFVMPTATAVVVAVLYGVVHRRLKQPPRVSVDTAANPEEQEELEARQSAGLVIRRHHFPDRLFAPAKRTTLLRDRANPVLDKELRSDIFAQGTLMLRVVILISMLLSVPLMAIFLFAKPEKAGYYVGYVTAFAMLVGPVFSAGSITQERERATLELLLTTLLRPWQIVWAKLFASLRVSTVLTLLLTEQIILAFLLVPELRQNTDALILYYAIILVTCLAATTLALFCSMLCRSTSAAMILTYVILLTLFIGPIGAHRFLETFTGWTYQQLAVTTVTSPFAAAMSVPLAVSPIGRSSPGPSAPTWPVYQYFLLFYPCLCAVVLGLTDALLHLRWRSTVPAQ